MKTLTNGSRVAEIQKTTGGFSVYVGFKGDNCPGEETIPARFFSGTCRKEYKTESGAMKAASRFIS